MNYKLFCLFAIALIVGSFSSANGQAALTQEQCEVQPIARVNCGEPGITPQQCTDKGCCFNKSDYDAIWCYFPHPQNEDCEA